jgi:hypothetical protein
MGFGSGGGGFTPSPNNVPGSTTTGTDKDTDTHQFTGSVDITGSLTLNGSSITGGGGGGTPGGSDTQIQYNNGGAFGGASALVYDDVNNHVGVGVADPDVILEVLDTSTQQKWSYDADSFATLTVAEDSNTTLATGENGNITLHAGPTGDIFLVADGGQVNLQNPLGTNKLAFDVENAAGLAYISNVRNNDLIFRVGTNVKEVFRLDQSEGALLMSGNFAEPGGFAPIHFRDTATSIHSPDFNRLALTAPTLEVTGTLGLNGTSLTSTAAELNLLDASNVTAPSEGIWAGVERVAVMDIGSDEYDIDTHALGVTIPDKAIITRAIIDVGTAFTTSGSPTLGLFTTGNIFPSPGEGAGPIDFFSGLGGSPNAPFQTISGVNSRVLQFTGGKLNGASTITFQVAAAALTGGAAKVYIYYILGS